MDKTIINTYNIILLQVAELMNTNSCHDSWSEQTKLASHIVLKPIFSNCFRIRIKVDTSLHWNIWRQKSRSQQLHHIPTPSVMPKSTLPREAVLYLVRDTWWIGSRLVKTRRILSSVCFFSHNSQSSFFFFKDSASSQQFNKMADSPSRSCFLCSTIHDELESQLVEFSGFFNPSKQTRFKFFSQNCQSSFFFFEEVASSNSS